jgi:tetratricopeptide (TPR) repeat protein
MKRWPAYLGFSGLLLATALVVVSECLSGLRFVFAAATPSAHHAVPSSTASAPTATAPPSAEPPAPKPTAAVQKIIDTGMGAAKAHQFAETLEAGNRAVAAARSEKDAVGEAGGDMLRSLALIGLRRNEEGIAALREAVATLRRAGDGPEVIEVLRKLAGALAKSKPAASRALLDQAEAAARAETRRPFAAARAFAYAAIDSADPKRESAARTLVEKALAVCERRAPNSLDVAHALHVLGQVAYTQSDLPAARRSYERSLALKEKLVPQSDDLAWTLDALGRVERDQDDFPAARKHLQHAMALREKLAPGSLRWQPT